MNATKHQSWHLFTNLCLHLCFLVPLRPWRLRPWCPTVLQEISEQAVSWVLAGAKALGEILWGCSTFQGRECVIKLILVDCRGIGS
jgi:hypothetical protein